MTAEAGQTPLPNAEDQVRSAIAEDLPEDEQTRRDWAGVFSLTRLLGLVTLVAGLGVGLWLAFALGRPWGGVAVCIVTLLWGGAAVSVSREGREVALSTED